MFGFGAAPPVEDQEVELDFEAESWRSSAASGSVDSSSSSSSSSISSGDSYLHCQLCAAEVAAAVDSGYQLNSDGRPLIIQTTTGNDGYSGKNGQAPEVLYSGRFR